VHHRRTARVVLWGGRPDVDYQLGSPDDRVRAKQLHAIAALARGARQVIAGFTVSVKPMVDALDLTDRLPSGTLGLADKDGCRVWIARWVTRDREQTCHTVLHELGHVAGMEHSKNHPRSIMHADPSRHDDRRCTRRKARKARKATRRASAPDRGV